MRKLLVISAALIIICTSGFTLCEGFIFFKEGASVTMTSYDDNGKVTGSFKTTYVKVSKTDSGKMVAATQEMYDKKGKQTSVNDFTVRCSNNSLYFDMKMMAGQQMAAMKDMEVKMEGTDMEMPTNLTVGKILKDADITMSFMSKGSTTPLMTMTMKTFNRKVEAKESVTTPAGTFECYKISEQVETKNSLFTMKLKSISWFSFDAGNVKVESYKENGKFMGKTELTELKK